MTTGPLAGVRILEFTQIIAGPLGCQHLADMGADVMKVEPLGGEPWRLNAQFVPRESKTYQSLNRGKRSLAIDMTRPEAQAAIHRLVPTVDVVVINYRPDVPARLHIDYETLSAIKPDLVYMDSTAFGRRGPWALKPGYDIVAQGVSGLTASAARFDERGTPLLGSIGVATADTVTGYAIAFGVCAALFHRAMTGEGQLVETSLLVNALVAQGSSVMALPPADTGVREPFMAALEGAAGSGMRYRELAEYRRQLVQGRQTGNIYYRNYQTSDGAIAIGNLSAALRQKMRDVLGIEHDPRDHDPEWDPRTPESVAFGEALVDRAEATIAEESTATWVERFEAAGVPVGPLLFPEQLMDHEQVAANGYRVDLDHDLTGPQSTVAPPITLSRSTPRPTRAAPPLGRDVDAILAEAGLDATEIAALRDAGVIL